MKIQSVQIHFREEAAQVEFGFRFFLIELEVIWHLQLFSYAPGIKERGYAVLPLCICLSVTNFFHIFLRNYLFQMLDIFTHSLCGNAIHWNSFLYQSDVIFLLNENFIFILNRQTNFRQRFFSSYSSQMLEILTHFFVKACHMGAFIF